MSNRSPSPTHTLGLGSCQCQACRNLAHVSERILTERTYMLALERQRQELLVERNDYHDPMSGRMPKEIISSIFKLCLPDDITTVSLHPNSSTRFTLSGPLVLSAVSQRWRAIVQSIPQLWSNVPLRVGPANMISLPGLAVEWIRRSQPRHYPLSINIYTNVPPSPELMSVLNACSPWWRNLRYEGPAKALSLFSSDASGILPLQTLSLRTFSRRQTSTFYLGDLILQPRRLELVNIPSLETVNIDWNFLTEVWIEDRLCAYECLEVIRRAPNLTRCTLRPDDQTDQTQFLSSPQNVIVHKSITELTLEGPRYVEILAHLSCPFLESLTIDMFAGYASTQLMVGFLQKSGCSLRNLILKNVWILEEDIGCIYEHIPTLHHLCIESTDAPIPAQTLFENLAVCPIASSGAQRPQYLPQLRSLTLRQRPLMDLTCLPSIFASPLPLTPPLRTDLRSVEISFGLDHILWGTSVRDILSDSNRQFLLALQQQDVSLKIEVRTGTGIEDLLFLRPVT